MGLFTRRFSDLKPEDPYYAAWVKWRRRRALALQAFFIWFPAGGALSLLLKAAIDTLCSCNLSPFVFLLSLAGIVIGVSIYVTDWPCPRCGKPFYREFLRYSSFADNCLHCGLPEYAPHGDC
jgi:hypothetical protein